MCANNRPNVASSESRPSGWFNAGDEHRSESPIAHGADSDSTERALSVQRNLVLPFDPPEILVEFEVDGKAITQGSKKAFVNKKTGRPIIVEDRNRDLDFWRGRVAEAASREMEGRPLYSCPIGIECFFTLSRPQALLRKPLALPTKNPDVDKLTRAIGDSIKDIVYVDDSQIVDLLARKRYVGHPQARLRPGVLVRISGYL